MSNTYCVVFLVCFSSSCQFPEVAPSIFSDVCVNQCTSSVILKLRFALLTENWLLMVICEATVKLRIVEIYRRSILDDFLMIIFIESTFEESNLFFILFSHLINVSRICNSDISEFIAHSEYILS